MAHHRGSLRWLVSLLIVITMIGGAAADASAGIFGPDVSNWQHPNGAAIDWSAVARSGQQFAFIKATEGPYTGHGYYTNPYFASDWKQAGAVGLYRGAYHHARPALPISTTAVAQARYFVSVTGTMHGSHDLPAVIDWEETGGLSASQLLSWLQSWLNEVQRLTGRAPIIYTYYYFWQTYMANTTALSNYRLWFARYTSDPSQVVVPGGWKTWTFWQYTDSASIPGIPTGVDDSRYCCAASNLAALGNGAAAPAAASNPFGKLDGLRRWPGGIQAWGWDIDPDTTTSLATDTYLDGRAIVRVTASDPSLDVARSYPGFGNYHRYRSFVPVTGAGSHTVCTFGLNVAYGTANSGLGCRDLTISNAPYGSFDTLRRVAGGLRVTGWAIDPDVSDPVVIRTALDGVVIATSLANGDRPDVARTHPGYGSAHGYSQFVPATSGTTHTVCTYADNAGAGSGWVRLGCGSLYVNGTPVGHFDAASRTGPSTVAIRGWAFDPDIIGSSAVQVFVNGQNPTSVIADTYRPDVGRAWPGFGDYHGFADTIQAATGARICLTAVDVDGPSTQLGCVTL